MRSQATGLSETTPKRSSQITFTLSYTVTFNITQFWDPMGYVYNLMHRKAWGNRRSPRAFQCQKDRGIIKYMENVAAQPACWFLAGTSSSALEIHSILQCDGACAYLGTKSGLARDDPWPLHGSLAKGELFLFRSRIRILVISRFLAQMTLVFLDSGKHL